MRLTRISKNNLQSLHSTASELKSSPDILFIVTIQLILAERLWLWFWLIPPRGLIDVKHGLTGSLAGTGYIFQFCW